METKTWRGPKAYYSYSQMRVWLEDRQAYRDRYYRGITERTSKYMMFGSEIAKGLEERTIVIPRLPLYERQEYEMQVEIDGIPVFGYIDQFKPELVKFREIKTGIMKPTGEPRWTDEAVKKHKQLDFYSLMLQIKHGTVDEECHLDWLVTRNRVKTITDPWGNVLEAKSGELELSGEVHSFPRIITQEERDEMRALIVKTAWEVHDDFANWKKYEKEQKKVK